LAVMLVSCRFFRLFSLLIHASSPNEVATGVVGIKAAGVDCGVRDRLPAFANPPTRVVDQPPNMLLLEQPSAGFLQRREMGNRLEHDRLPQIRAAFQKL